MTPPAHVPRSRRWGRLGLGIGIAALLMATPASAQNATAPAVMSDDWRQVRTPGLTVIGTARGAALREVANDIEAFRAALSNLFPNARVDGPVPTFAVVLEDFNAFRRYQPLDSRGRRMGNVGGYFNSEPHANYLVFPYVKGESGNGLVYHEYAHYFVRQNTRAVVPLWLNEGLAEFYSTFRPQFEDSSMIGAPPQARLRTLKENVYLPIRDLVSPRDVEKLWRSGRIDMFYAEAWALVHYIAIGRKNPVRAPIDVYLNTLAASDSQDEAFKAAFGVDVAGMDRELRDYVRHVSFQALVVPRVAPARITTVETIREADARQLQASMLELLDQTDESDSELQRALALDASDVQTRVTLGRLRLRQDRDAEAVAVLQEVAASAPADLSAQYYLGDALFRQWRHEEALAAFTRAVGINERNPYAWLRLGEAALALGRTVQAAASLQRAVQLEHNPGFYRTYAQTAFGLGLNDAAAANVRRYLDEIGLADQGAQYAGFLGAIAELRAERQDQSERLLAEIEAAVRSGTWAETVLRFLQNKLSAEAFLAKAGDVGERTEAHTYIGLTLDLAGRREEAITHFQWVALQGSRSYTEYAIAKAELRRFASASRPGTAGPAARPTASGN